MKTNTYIQDDIFPVKPEIAGLGITKFEIRGAEIKAQVEGVTTTNDAALIDNFCWQKAIAAWLLTLCGDDLDAAIVEIKKSYVALINRQGEAHRETEIPPRSNILDITNQAHS